jgi:hypothetical protein
MEHFLPMSTLNSTLMEERSTRYVILFYCLLAFFFNNLNLLLFFLYYIFYRFGSLLTESTRNWQDL